MLLRKSQSPFFQRHPSALTDHLVIEDIHIQQFACLDNRARHRDIVIIYMANPIDIATHDK
jgi:hypothetical protein